MKQRLPMIAAACSCVLTLACLVQIVAMNRKIKQLESSLSNKIQMVNSSVWEIRSEIDSRLAQEASLLSGKRFDYGEPEIKGATIALHCSVTPKELIPGETTATLYWSGGEAPLTLEQGSFTTTLALPLFSDSLIDKVVFAQDGVLRTEAIDLTYSPRGEFLPWIYTFFEGSSSGSNGSYHREGNLQLDMNSSNPGLRATAVTLIELLDGKEVGRAALIPDPESIHGEDPYSFRASYPVDATYEVPAGSAHELWVDIRDAYGLHYRLMVDRWVTDGQGNGAPDDSTRVWYGDEAIICDEQGKILYQPSRPEQ